ncbi:MAG TPA: beta-glucosidase BglX [Solirubrobacteraceae bacterium]|nr:beta-glucosidase BglX [Solirubrobacteraceae bacterium]
MAERVARVVGDSPRRRIGFGTIAAALIAAAVLLAAGVFASAPAARASSGAARAHARHGHSSARSARQPNQQQINAKVNALIQKMTVAEKFGQLEMSGPQGPNGTPGQSLINDAKNGLVGSVLDLVGVDNINTLQQAALQSRLHIPLIFSLDVIHGYKTMYPISLGESSSWDPALATQDASMAASEATADGIRWTFSPMVDVTRDPRWGRVQGTSGEDPFLGAALAAARIHGYQGPNYRALDKMAATIKHFAAYGAPVAGREYNTVDMSTQQLFNDYLPTYKAGVDAGVATVMSAFNSLNGVPATANRYTLQTILRDEWGFGGTVVSDYQAVQELEEFGYAANDAQAAQEALTAGVDIEMAVQLHSPNSTYENAGPQLLAQGKITMGQLDNAVRHVLTLKYLAGMFAHPSIDPNRVKTAELTPAHLQQARTAADESMVLLNNNNHTLPLSTSTPSIAVVGPLADDALDQLGPDVPIGYDTTPAALSGGGADKIVTVLDGIKNVDHNVTYAQGCDAYCTSTAGFPAAVSAAQSAAETVIVVGEPSAYSGEASSRSMLDLPGNQLQLIQQIAATGKPYVVVLMNGRPLTIDWLAQNAKGLLEAWYPGTEGGDAVADVLFGKVNPGGKLPMSFPHNVGQIPISYNELPTGRPFDPNNKYTSKYLDVPNTPTYPFGYGLSYTTFSLTSPHLSTTSVSPTGTLTVKDTITNTGSVTGDDVVQLYLHEDSTSILQPVKKLEGFQRVTLARGQSKTVTFTLNRRNFGYYDDQGQFVVQPGPFNVWVSDSSAGGTPSTFTLG